MMVDRLQTDPLPLQIPMGKEEDFQGIIDLVSMKAILYDPHSLGTQFEITRYSGALSKRGLLSRGRSWLRGWRNWDESLMEKFVEGKEVSESELKRAVREGDPPIKRNSRALRRSLPE